MKTEKEKMLAGEFYNTRDPELIQRHHLCRSILKEYNNLGSKEFAAGVKLLDRLFKGVKKDVWIERPFYCDYGENIFIGQNTFVNSNCNFIDDNTIHIGRDVLIGPAVQIYTASHPVNPTERVIDKPIAGEASFRTSTAPVRIGDRVWIGGGAIILPGVTIGNGVTIGAGSVVTRDIPDHVLAVGNPCRVIKEIPQD